jgi:uncharacterized membrane protein
MQGFVEFLKGWQLHPVVDHFTVSLIIIAVVMDLVGSLAPTRLWIRYMAATLMVFGAIAAAGSNLTGGWEADRVWDHLTGPAKEVLAVHAKLGDILPWVFGILAVWRVGLQFAGFLARTRFVYLFAAVVAGGAILYQGSEGGELVYDYGVGTALMTRETPSPAASAGASEQPAPIPTVYVPSPAQASPTTLPSAVVPTPSVTPAAPSKGSASSSPGASPSVEGSPPAAKSTTL